MNIRTEFDTVTTSLNLDAKIISIQSETVFFEIQGRAIDLGIKIIDDKNTRAELTHGLKKFASKQTNHGTLFMNWEQLGFGTSYKIERSEPHADDWSHVCTTKRLDLLIRDDCEYRVHALFAHIWQDTLAAYSRCARAIGDDFNKNHQVDTGLFTSEYEVKLYDAIMLSEMKIQGRQTMETVLWALRDLLVTPINDFWDNCLVNCPDDAIKNNRLAMMQAVKGLTSGYADLSKLKGY